MKDGVECINLSKEKDSMKRYSLFGGGEVARQIIVLLGKEKIDCIYDNNDQKWGTTIEGVEICKPPIDYEEVVDRTIVISVSPKYQKELIEQVEALGIHNYVTFQDIMVRMTKEHIADRKDYIDVYKRAISWIKTNSLDEGAIICTSKLRKGYPEVTGYYIPTLLRWGYRDRALSYAKWLCEIQKSDGSWYDTNDKDPYIFDSAQILKGLIAIHTILPATKEHIVKGCDWIISRMDDNGRLITPVKDAWGREGMCSELIHLYCLSPLYEAAGLLDMPKYKEAADKILAYYKKYHYDEIINFRCLSHFYAYIMEALLDVGEIQIAKEAMENIAAMQKEDGSVPAYKDVDWICSTGLFQFALVWYRLGDVERANKAFNYACDLQNETGGWFGSYLSEDGIQQYNDYFPVEEISWANKFFLDALFYKGKAEFNLLSDSIMSDISCEDGRYKIIYTEVKKSYNVAGQRVLDVGCGKGRYLKNLLKNMPNNRYFGVDLSQRVLDNIVDPRIEKKEGSLTCIQYEDNQFDITYSCEALEHAIDIRSAIGELARVTKAGGKIIIIDKNREAYGRLQIRDWEVWFGVEELREIMEEFCSEVIVHQNVSYESKKNDELFAAWIGIVK